jgi:hypothetical protein
VTPADVLAAAAQAGVVVELDAEGQLTVTVDAPGQLTAEIRQGFREHKGRLVAVLQLREIHRAMGFDDADVEFIEEALLSGRVAEICIVSRPPSGAAA